jgi:mono/diheme cytochrome c family protein
MPRLLIFPLIAVCAISSAALADETVERGRAIVEADCGPCHATGRQGDSPLAAAPPFRTLGQRYPVSDLAEALAEGILTGHPEMPEFEFGAEQVDAIIAYLDSIQVN